MRYRNSPAEVGLNLSVLDDDSVRSGDGDDDAVREMFELRAHIFVGHKAAWMDVVEDGVPMYDRFSPGFDEQLNSWQKQRDDSQR